MQYTIEQSLVFFNFWAGGKDTAEKLTSQELELIDEYLDGLCQNDKPLTATQINDFFWFDYDTREDGESVIESIIGRKIWEE